MLNGPESDEPCSGRYSRLLVVALGVGVAILAGWAYFNCLFLFFAQDDFWLLSHAQKAGHESLCYLRGTLPEYVRPIPTCWTSHLLYSCGGVEPQIYKAVQLGVFLGSAFVLWLLLRELTRSGLAAMLGTIVFAFSPVHTFTLGWFSGFIDNLSLLFFFAALLSLVRLVGPRRPSWLQAWLLLIFYAAALFSKEVGILLLPVAYAVVGTVAKVSGRRLERPEIGGLAGMTLLTVIYVIVRKLVVVPSAGSIGLCCSLRRAMDIWCYAADSIPLFTSSFVHRHTLLMPVLLVLLVLILVYLWRSLKANGLQRDHLTVFLATGGVGFLLFVLNTAVFMFHAEPVTLRDYYGTISLTGIAMALSGLLAWLMRVCARRLPEVIVVLALAIYACLGAVLIHSVVERDQSPSLLLQGKARFFHDQIRPHVAATQAGTIVVRGVDELTWWASGQGEMVPAMFSGRQAYFPQFDTPRKIEAPILNLTVRPDASVEECYGVNDPVGP